MEDSDPTTHTADWTAIGYSAPGTGNSNSYESNVIAYTGADKSWTATAKVDLNDCPKNTGKWQMSATINGTNVSYANGTASVGTCINLTPAWTGLYRSSN